MSNTRHRILFIVPSLARAGAETQVVHLVNGLCKRNLDIHLLCFEQNTDLLDALDAEKIYFHHAPRNSRFDLNVPRHIARLIDQHAIEVVHCSLQIALLMGWLAIQLAKTKPKLIFALHTTIHRDLKSEVFDWLLYGRLMRRCDRIICVCKNQKQHWIAKFPFLKSKITVIYNGVDTARFSPNFDTKRLNSLRTDVGISDGDIVVSHIAAFRPEKGHMILLDALLQLCSKQDIPLVLLFIGDGVLKVEVEEAAKVRGLEKHVRFLGLQADVRPWLSISDLVVLPSTAETFSLAMLEAMSMEKPLVASDLGGIAEAVIPGETGFLVRPGDTKHLVTVLETALSDTVKLRQLGLQARSVVTERFSQSTMIEQTFDLLSHLINSP
jgi:glycosyltransferase involved in cell wall biosynthesis